MGSCVYFDQVDQYQGGRNLDELKQYVSRMLSRDQSEQLRTDEMIVEGSLDDEPEVRGQMSSPFLTE